MTRNLVKEREEDTPIKDEPFKEEQKTDEVKVITFEALIANNLDALNVKIDNLSRLLLEGFKQVGVKFPE